MTFKLRDSEFIPLNNLLKVLRLVGTGGEANIRIENEEVMVNGVVETQKRKKIKPGDQVTFDNNNITVEA